MANIEFSSSLALFRPLRLFKSTNTYKLHGGNLSYTRCKEIFKECLKEIGVDHKLYGLHSLRSGGATSAVKPAAHVRKELSKMPREAVCSAVSSRVRPYFGEKFASRP